MIKPGDTLLALLSVLIAVIALLYGKLRLNQPSPQGHETDFLIGLSVVAVFNPTPAQPQFAEPSEQL